MEAAGYRVVQTMTHVFMVASDKVDTMLKRGGIVAAQVPA
jgi:hypothetical protein